jgi:hypothetical protein
MTTVSDELGYDDSRHDPDDALRELLERQHLIVEMQESPGWKMWMDYLAALAQPYQNRLLRGRHKDMLDYRYDAGLCEGIRLALTAHEQLASSVTALRMQLAEQSLANQEEDHVQATAP